MSKVSAAPTVEPMTAPAIESTVSQRVTPRAFLIGLVLALVICAVLPYNDYFVGATFLSGNWFPIGGVAALLLLVLFVNPALLFLKRPTLVFSPAEIITIWAMIVVVAGIPSSGLMRYLISMIVSPHYYASSANGWNKLVLDHMPSRLIVSDPTAIRPFFEGLKSGETIPWRAWALPLFYWLQFIALLYGIFFCMASLLRRQWVETERFTFPLVKLPVMMAQAPEPGRKLNSLMRDPLLWSAVALVTLLHSVKGLHLLYPTVPDIQLTLSSGTFITTAPFNAVNDIEFEIFPLVIGFAYLISSDVSLSLWFFYIVMKLQVLYAAMHSWDMTGPSAGVAMGSPAFVAYQEAGGTVMLAAWLVWSMRVHIKEVWRKAISNSSDVDDSHEPMPYRLALFGFIGCYIGFFLWLTLVASVEPVMALGMAVGSFVIFLMLSWMVAQSGVLFMQQSFSPVQITAALIGKTLSVPTASLASGMLVEDICWLDARELMLPAILNTQKGASESALSARSLMKSLAICVACALVVSAIAAISLPYSHGGATSLKDTWGYIQAPQIPFNWAANQAIRQGTGSSDLRANLLTNAGIGGAVVAGLFALRSAMVSFPISPAGFLIASTYPMYMLWFSIFIGWAVKSPILRYGGMQGYRRLLPFFLGLILGDCLNAIIWTIVGLATHVGYRLLPG